MLWMICGMTLSNGWGQTSLANDTLSCQKLLLFEYDKMTGSGTWRQKEAVRISEKENGLMVCWMKIGNSYVLVIQTVKGVCIDESAQIILLFTDGHKATIYANSKFNCDGNAPLYFGGVFGRRDLLSRLASSKLVSIRLHTYRSYIQLDMPDFDAEILRASLVCLQKK